jgi:hypothetical protein
MKNAGCNGLTMFNEPLHKNHSHDSWDDPPNAVELEFLVLGGNMCLISIHPLSKSI